HHSRARLGGRPRGTMVRLLVVVPWRDQNPVAGSRRIHRVLDARVVTGSPLPRADAKDGGACRNCSEGDCQQRGESAWNGGADDGRFGRHVAPANGPVVRRQSWSGCPAYFGDVAVPGSSDCVPGATIP